MPRVPAPRPKLPVGTVLRCGPTFGSACSPMSVCIVDPEPKRFVTTTGPATYFIGPAPDCDQYAKYTKFYNCPPSSEVCWEKNGEPIDPPTEEELSMIEIQGNPGGGSAPAKPITLDIALPPRVAGDSGTAADLIAEAIATGALFPGTTLAPVEANAQAITGQSDGGVIYGGQTVPDGGGNVRDTNGVTPTTEWEVPAEPANCEWTPVVCFCVNLTDKELAAVAA